MTSNDPYVQVLTALILTIVIEGIAILLIKKKKEYLGYSVLVNLITNPPLNLIVLKIEHSNTIPWTWFFIGGSTAPYIITLEIIVVLIEAVCYNAMTGMGMKKALGLSFALNAISYLAGLLISWVYWEFFW